MLLRDNNINKEKWGVKLLPNNKVFINIMFIKVSKIRYGQKYQFLWFVFINETGTLIQLTRYFLSMFKLIIKIKLWTIKLQQILIT